MIVVCIAVVVAAAVIVAAAIIKAGIDEAVRWNDPDDCQQNGSK